MIDLIVKVFQRNLLDEKVTPPIHRPEHVVFICFSLILQLIQSAHFATAMK